MAIAKLSIDLEAKLANLQAGLDKAGFMAERSAARIQKSFDGLTSLAAGIGGGIAAGFSVSAFASFFKATVDGVDKLNDLKDATGASIENLSALEDIAARTGTSVDVMGDAVVKLNKALADAKPGSDQAQAFEALGLSIEELKRLDPAEMFQRVSIAAASFADDGNKARIMMELTGRSLREIAPLMKDVAEAGTLNATVTAQQAEEAEKFNKELFALQKTVTDAARSLAGPMISALNETIAKFREGAKEGKSFYRVIFEEQLKLLGLGKLLPNNGGATGSWEDGADKPSLPALKPPAKRQSGGAAAKDDAAARVRLAEFAARQIVDIEEQSAADTAAAWKVWEDQQLDLAKERADAEKEQWRQVFEFIDQQQDDAIEQGQAAAAAAKQAVDDWSIFADQAARNIQTSLGDTLVSAMEGNFRGIADGWKRMLDRMVAEALAAKIAKSLLGDFGSTGNIGGWAGDFFKWAATLTASAKGNVFAGGAPVTAFAAGGIFGQGGGLLTRPTLFPMARGMGLAGEAGPEAVMPLRRGRGGRLGVEMAGGGGIVVNQTMHITMQGGPADRRSMLQLQADIGAATQRALARNT